MDFDAGAADGPSPLRKRFQGPSAPDVVRAPALRFPASCWIKVVREVHHQYLSGRHVVLQREPELIGWQIATGPDNDFKVGDAVYHGEGGADGAGGLHVVDSGVAADFPVGAAYQL